MATAHDTNTNNPASRAADSGRQSFNAAADGAQRFTEQVSQMFSFSGDRGEELSRQSAQNLEVITEASTALRRGFDELSREWLGLVQGSVQRNVNAMTALSCCRSLPDFAALQTEFMRDSLQQTIEGFRRMGEVSTRVADEATQSVSKTSNTRRRAA